ncbi:MAG TPA: hypothetical protein ENG45_00245 [Candidatus Aenigmarchaeota archaeon]|nr:hypothetical protein [Candidatus Aenigmarchaeota archaeon]
MPGNFPNFHILKIESVIAKSALRYFLDNGFELVQPAQITLATGACENIATMFELSYFGKKVFLTQTDQTALEIALREAEKVFSIGPSFRKEERVDDTHLTNFPLWEYEFRGDFKQLLVVTEEIIKSMIEGALNSGLLKDTSHLEKALEGFERVTYTEAINLLEPKFENIEWGVDLKRKHEQFLVKEFGGVPLFITHFPNEDSLPPSVFKNPLGPAIKFFNMKVNRKNKDVVNSADLILPIAGEGVGSAERETDPKILERKLKSSSMYKMLVDVFKSQEEVDRRLAVYMENVKIGLPPHAGGGIGFNRVVQYILKAKSIYDATVFPTNALTVW